MNYLPLPLNTPPFIVLITISFVRRRWSWTSKWRHNFLLQHETRKMGEMFLVILQKRVWTWIRNLHPDSIAFFQVQCRLEGQRTILTNGAAFLLNLTPPDPFPVQKKIRLKHNRTPPRWRSYNTRHSRKREKINSRPRCREYPRRQIHGIPLVHPRQLERNWIVSWVKIRFSSVVKWIIFRDVEIDGRRFDVGVSDPFLFVCKQNQQNIMIKQ